MAKQSMRELASDMAPALMRTPNGVFLVTYQGDQAHVHPLHTPFRVTVTVGPDAPGVYEVTPELGHRIVMQRAPSEHLANEYPLWYAEDW